MTELSLERLDEIGRALFAGVLPPTASLAAAELIPYAEWHFLRAAGHRLGELGVSDRLVALRQALRGRAASWIDPQRHAGFIRVRRAHEDVRNIEWVRFLLALSQAGQASGLAKGLANEFTGVVKEMEDNIHLHSDRPNSGLVAFLGHQGMFEVVILDLGIGVLASLRKAPEFAGLPDHGIALQRAIETGSTRFGSGSGHGQGFSDLTVGIVNQNALLRFRSGDHVLQIDGRSSGSISSLCAPRAMTRGFMIAVQVRCSAVSASA